MFINFSLLISQSKKKTIFCLAMLYFEPLMVSTNFAAPSTHNRDVIKMTIPAQYVKARYKLLSSITEECSTISLILLFFDAGLNFL